MFDIGEKHFQKHNGFDQQVTIYHNELWAQQHYLEGMFQSVHHSSRDHQDRAL